METILEIGVAYIIAFLFGIVAIKFRQSVIPAFIIGGIIIGPHGMSIIANTEFIEGMATIGMIFLLLFLGLEFTIKDLLKSRHKIGISGITDVLINFPIGFLLGIVIGLGTIESLFMGGIVYVSSSGIITKALVDLKKLANPETETILGIMVFEDVFIAIFMALLSGIAFAGEFSVGNIIASASYAIIFCLIFIIIARKYSHVVAKIIDVSSEELFMILIFSLVMLVASAAKSAGISEALGAFLLGLVFAETVHIERIKSKVFPLRDLFASMFFFFFGMSIDIKAFYDILLIILVAVIISIIGKMITGIIVAKIFGSSLYEGVSIGTGTVARGEFSLILANIAASAGFVGIIQPLTAAYVLILAIIGPILMNKSDEIYKYISNITSKL